MDPRNENITNLQEDFFEPQCINLQKQVSFLNSTSISITKDSDFFAIYKNGCENSNYPDLFDCPDLRRKFLRKIFTVLFVQTFLASVLISTSIFYSEFPLQNAFMYKIFTESIGLLSVLLPIVFSLYKSWCNYVPLMTLVLGVQTLLIATFLNGISVLNGDYAFLLLFSVGFTCSTCLTMSIFTLQSTMELNMLSAVLIIFTATITPTIITIVLPFTHTYEAEPVVLLSFFVSTFIGIYIVAVVRNMMVQTLSSCHPSCFGHIVSPLKKSHQWPIAVIQIYLLVICAAVVVPSIILISLISSGAKTVQKMYKKEENTF